MPVRGLTIVVADAQELRLRSALGLALSHAALGGAARVFLDTVAVALVRRPVTGAEDAAHVAAGLPTLDALIGEALDAGVTMLLCQAGMAMAAATAADFDPRVQASGMVSLLQTLGEDRLVTV